MSIRYQVRGHEVRATEQCLWCLVVLEGLGKTQEHARRRLGEACAKHLCDAKRNRNVTIRHEATS